MAQDRDVARDRIHLDHGDVRAEGERRVALLEDQRRSEPRLLLREALRVGGDGCDLAPRHATVRHTGDADAPVVADDDVLERRLELVGHDAPRLGHDLLGGAVHRRTSELQRARPAGTRPALDAVGVPLDEGDVLDRDVGEARDELGERRLVTLPVVGGADTNRGAAGLVDLDLRPLLRVAFRGGDLDVARHADAELHGVAGVPPPRLLRP